MKVATHLITGVEVAIKIIDKTNLNEGSLAKVRPKTHFCDHILTYIPPLRKSPNEPHGQST